MTTVSPTRHDPVLLTGCSSGIGRAAAKALLAAGHTVVATARKPETLTELADLGATTLKLDVTDDESMRAAVAAVESEFGRVGALVNNAGYGVYGPVEEVDLGAVRAMFETNVFGPSRLTQLVLPGMRAAGDGVIVNVGSMGGRLAFPVGGFYHASKYAVEALTDSLRNEVRQFGISVVLVEPGPIRTNFEQTINSSLATDDHPRDPASPYADLVEKVTSVNAEVYSSPKLSAGSQGVAAAVVHAVQARRPKTRYVVTPVAQALIQTRRFGGDRVWDAVVRRSFR